MKKKLLVTGSTFPRWKGDTEPRFVLDLSEALTEYFDVTVLVPAAPGAKEKEIMNGVKVIRYHYFPIHKYETLCYPGAIVPRIKEKKVRLLLVPFLCLSLFINLFKRRKEYDIVHAHWLIPQGIIQSFLSMPYIVTGHGGDVTSLNNSLVKRLKQRCLKKAGYVTAVSSHLENVIKGIYPINNISIQPMGCKTENFGKQYFAENYFNQKDRKVVLFVGRLAEKKGIAYLIEAMKNIDNAILIIVGKGPLEKELKDQAKEQGDTIKFLGAKTHEELRTIYASADVFVAPSVTAKDGDQEGFGLVILEAMASGLPVVASNSGGITEIIKDGNNGLLVPEKDVKILSEKINEVLYNTQLKQMILKNSKQTVQKYDYKTIAKNYKDIIEKVI